MRLKIVSRVMLCGLAVSGAGCAVGVPATVQETAPTVGAPSGAPSRNAAADEAHTALWAIYESEAPEGTPEGSRAAYEFGDQKRRRFAAAAKAFGEQFPNDPRRYNSWVQSSFTRPSFIAGFKPEFDQAPGGQNLIIDREALNAFRERQLQLLTQVVEAPDASWNQRGGGFQALMIESRVMAQVKGQSWNIEQLQPVVDRVVARVPDERAMPVISQYLDALRSADAAKAQAYETRLKAVSGIAKAMAADEVARQAKAVEDAAAATRRAAEIGTLKFIAADGREVDLAKMRGKVVLIDFWATWCGPCIAELPNVKKVYDTYHAQGFEIVGITLESNPVRPGDTPEQAAAKLEASKQNMLQFVGKRELPWVQHFDGRYFDSPLATRYGIDAIPAMFLLDKQGKIASSQARGPSLEVEVKRLLAEPRI